MKRIILSFSMAALVMSSFAQSQTKYDRSVFKDYDRIAANNEASFKNRERVAALFPSWSATFDKLSGSVTRLYGAGMQFAGVSPLDQAQNCIKTKLKDLGINPAEWVLVRNSQEANASFVDFKQVIGGREVFQSRLGFHFTTDGKLISIIVRNYGSNGIANNNPALTKEQVLDSRVIYEGLEDGAVKKKEIANDMVWFPLPTAAGYDLRPAYMFTLSAKANGSSIPVELRGYVDAVNGNLLYRQNKVKEGVTVTVSGDVNKTSTSAVASLPLPHLMVQMNGNTLFTDTSGTVTDNTPGNLDVFVGLQGRFVKVNDDPWSWTPMYSLGTVAPGNYTFSFLPSVSPASNSKHTNVYYHVNKVHDHMKRYMPSFTSLDMTMDANVDIFDPTGCNAFFDGSSINFLQGNSTCPSFATFADVIYHEYGHGITGFFYAAATGRWWGVENGALNEGNSDVWAMSILEDGLIGQNFAGNGTVMRRYDQRPRIYPTDIMGESHRDGEIIAGIWYDLATEMRSFPKMTSLFTKTYNDVPDGPDGTEGEVYRDVLLSALLNDDNDGNISNGTPNGSMIEDVFARHGIVLFDAVVSHNELSNQINQGPYTVNATVNSGTLGTLKEVKLHYRNRTAGTNWAAVAMVKNGSNYSANIPVQMPNTIVEYYVAAYANGGAVVTAPAFYNPAANNTKETNTPYQFAIQFAPKTVTDFETPAAGWTIGGAGGDNATSGTWVQAAPVSSKVSVGGNNVVVQTGNDHTTGAGQCLVTGNASSPNANYNNADVDNGVTSVISPAFDISSYTKPLFEYHRWYSNNRGGNPGNDFWKVMVADASQSEPDWITVEETNISDHSWRRRVFNIKDYLPNAKNVQIKFVASDSVGAGLAQAQSTVEAGVDDFIIYDLVKEGISDLAAIKADIYPNPANDKVNIVVPAGLNGTIGLYDITGKAISLQDVDAQTTQYTINTAGIAAGNYLIKLQSAAGVQVQKITVKH